MNTKIDERTEEGITAYYEVKAPYYLFFGIGKIRLYKKIAGMYKIHWRTVENHIKKYYAKTTNLKQ